MNPNSNYAMKSILLIFALTCFASSVIAQSPSTDNFNGNLVVNNQIRLGDTTQEVVEAFGQPDSVSSEYWDIPEVTATYYYYTNGAEFYFVDQKLDSFLFTTPIYFLSLDSFQLKVGNSIHTLQGVFPKSYANRGVNGAAITLGPPDADHLYIDIGTNASGIITEIDIRTM